MYHLSSKPLEKSSPEGSQLFVLPLLLLLQSLLQEKVRLVEVVLGEEQLNTLPTN
jgi:hypothetical protein